MITVVEDHYIYPNEWFEDRQRTRWADFLAVEDATLIEHETGSLALFQRYCEGLHEGHIWVPENHRAYSVKIGREMLDWFDQNRGGGLLAKTKADQRHTKHFLRMIGFIFVEETAEAMGLPYSYFVRIASI